MIETPTKPQFQPFPTTRKRFWVPSLNRLAVRGRPDLDPRKKSRQSDIARYVKEGLFYIIFSP